IEAGIGRIIRKAANRIRLIIPVLIFIIGLGAGSFGMNEEVLAFIPFLIPLCIAMGFDSMTGLAIALVGTSAGYAGSFVQASNVGVSQTIAGLPLYSAMWFRLIILAVMLTLASIYVFVYAGRIKKDPTRSLVYELDRTRTEKMDLDNLPELTTTRKLVLLVLGLTFALLIVGVLQWGWYITELSGLFLGMGIVTGFIARIGLNGFGLTFAKGVAEFSVGALVVGFARGILIVLTSGNILDTILYASSGVITALPKPLVAMGMYVFQCLLNVLIPSASGQAAASLPILLPMADMAGITRQTTCIIFQIGDGLSNILTPTAGVFMVALSMAKIPWSKWAKWFLPLVGMQYLAGAILILIANAINLGPM
ncbi:AbgT family transporter, partial [Ruminococcaceae bacterium OttesenSCG-928-A11]|nr:AbgT family transporter [Ruminococcaceae bacterium OttesenSCG-928-A11]